MKRILLFNFFLFTQVFTSLRAQQVEWMDVPYFHHSALSGDIAAVTGMATDQDENVYLTGDFGGWNNSQGSFIGKYDMVGNVMWVDTINGAEISDIVKCGSGLYVTGCCRWTTTSQLQFGSYILTKPGPNAISMFIVKYDTSGNVIWANLFNVARGINIDSYNNQLYLTGFGSHVQFGDKYFDEGYFLSQFDTNGTCNWVTYVDDKEIKALTVSNENNIYTGFFSSQARFINKYNSYGQFQWTRQLPEDASNIAADKYGNCYLTGQCFSSGNFDGHIVTNPYYNDWQEYFAKLDSSGTFDWAIAPAQDSLSLGAIFVHDSTLYTSGYIGYPKRNAGNYYAKYDLSGQLLEYTPLVVYPSSSTSNSNRYTIGGLHNNGIYVYGREGEQFLTGYIGKISYAVSVENPVASSGELSIYPNPGSVFTLQYTGASEAEYSLSVKNAVGQVIISRTYPVQRDLTAVIDLEGYSSGVYFVELLGGDKREVRRLIVK